MGPQDSEDAQEGEQDPRPGTEGGELIGSPPHSHRTYEDNGLTPEDDIEFGNHGRLKEEMDKINNNNERQGELQEISTSTERSSSSNLIIWSTNVDTLTNDKHTELTKLVADSEVKPDIITMSEVKSKRTNINWSMAQYKLQGYVTEENVKENTGRGMIMYIKNTVQYDLLDSRDYSGEVAETQLIKLHAQEPIILCSIYRSPNSNTENDEKINVLLRKLSEEKIVIVTGDFNYPAINWELMTNTTAAIDRNFRFVESIKDCFLQQHVNKNTRGRGSDTPSLLDLVITKQDSPAPELDYLAPLGKSDHCIIQVEFNVKIKLRKYQQKRFNYRKGNFTLLRNKLNIEWEERVQDSLGVEESWSVIKSLILKTEEECVPQMKTMKGTRRHATPLDIELREKIKKKKRLWNKYTRTKEETDRKSYCKIRNQVKKLVRREKKLYEQQIAKEAKANPKKFWAYINRKTKNSPQIPSLYKDGDTVHKNLTESDIEKVEELASFFRSVYTRDPPGRWDLPMGVHQEMSDESDISEMEVFEVLKGIKPDKSMGPDQVHPRILTEAKEVLTAPLTALFNKSLNDGKLPTDWKKANIIPIFKKGDRREAANYRPVSLTSVICKIMEKVVRNKLLGHMQENNLLSKKQFGFLPGRSTLLQLLLTMEKWVEELESGNDVDIIYLDFQKAFDKVSHSRLLTVLTHYGVGGKYLNWIRDFLDERGQRVCHAGVCSQWNKVLSGVPQGSVLGPILFVIFINSLPEVVAGSDICLFADDVKLYKGISSIAHHDELQADVNRLASWTQKALLRFNPSKCKSMTIFRTSNTRRRYSLADSVLEFTEQERDLGVIIDSKLSFEAHMMEKAKKANRILGLIRHTFDYLDKSTFLQLYKSLVRPHLEYCNSVWQPHLVKHIKLIENVQRRATKLIPGLRDLSYEHRLKTLKLPTLEHRRKRGDMIETFKILNNHYDPELVGHLFEINPRTSRGTAFKLYKKYTRYNLRYHTFSYRVVDTWNSLPDTVVNADSVKTFERQLDKHWRNMPSVYATMHQT